MKKEKGDRTMKISKFNKLFHWDLVRSCLYVLLIALLTAFAINLVIGWTWMAVAVSLIGWSYAVCFTPFGQYFFANPKSVNTALVLVRRISKPEEAPQRGVPGAFANLKPTKNLKVVFGPGLVGISPLWKVGYAVGLARAMKLGGMDITVQTSDGIKGVVTFGGFATVIQDPEAIMNLVRQKPGYALAQFNLQLIGHVRAVIKSMTYDELISSGHADPDCPTNRITGHELANRKFSGFFGGPNTICDTEWQLGFQTGVFGIEKLEMDNRATNAAQANKIATENATAIGALVDKGVHPDIAANLVAAAQDLTLPTNAITIATGRGGDNTGQPGTPATSGPAGQQPIIIIQTGHK